MIPTQALTQSRSRPEPTCGDLDGISWPEYREALQTLVHASCCGAGSGGGFAATPVPDAPRFAKLGYAAWRKTVKPAAPILPVESGPLVLPAVTIADPQQVVRPNVDLFIANGRIERISPRDCRRVPEALLRRRMGCDHRSRANRPLLPARGTVSGGPAAPAGR